VKKIYCLSGLGADARVFSKLIVPGYKLVHLKWLPFSKKDTLETYAIKMAELIDEADPVIIGVSFGGMLATEIAKRYNTTKTILISSAKTKGELPVYHGILRSIIINRLIPPFFLKIGNPVIYDMFGAHSSEERKMLSEVFKHSDGDIMSHAMKAIVLWENNMIPANLIHIHGTSDKIIPFENVKPDYVIEGGSHIMIYNRAGEISKIIAKELE